MILGLVITHWLRWLHNSLCVRRQPLIYTGTDNINPSKIPVLRSVNHFFFFCTRSPQTLRLVGYFFVLYDHDSGVCPCTGYEGSTTRSVRSVRSARSASRSHTPAPAPTTSQNYPNQGPALDTDTIDSELGAQHIDPFVKQQHDAHDSDNDSDLSIDYDTELEPKFVEITELKHNHRAAPSHASEIEPQAPSGGRFLMRPNRARGAPRRGVVNDSKHARARSSGSIPNKDDANRRFAASGNVLSPHSDMGARPSDVPPPNIAPSPAPPIDSESAPMPKPDVLPPPVPSNGEVGMMAMPSSAVKVPLPPTDRDLSDSDTENYTQVSYVN